MAHIEFVLEDELEELTVAEAGGGGLLESHVKGLHEAGEAQLPKGGLEVGHGLGLGVSVGSMR